MGVAVVLFIARDTGAAALLLVIATLSMTVLLAGAQALIAWLGRARTDGRAATGPADPGEPAAPPEPVKPKRSRKASAKFSSPVADDTGPSGFGSGAVRR